jgi:hypothetical protein
MRAKPLKTRDLILSLSKDEAKISGFFSRLLVLALIWTGTAADAIISSRREKPADANALWAACRPR